MHLLYSTTEQIAIQGKGDIKAVVKMSMINIHMKVLKIKTTSQHSKRVYEMY